MVPCALLAARLSSSAIERVPKAVVLGSAVGLTGAGGQLLLFQSLRSGPAFIVFPVVAMYPVLTIVLSAILLKERTSRRGAWGVALALPAIGLLSFLAPDEKAFSGYSWMGLAALVFVFWGVQAFVMKYATASMSAEGLFFYMTASAVLLIPVALWMTDFQKPINWGLRGPYLAALVQSLNSAGALAFVYAIRYGKAIVVTPMTALAPVITVVLSLAVYGRIPSWYQTLGIGCATAAMYLMAE
jgi:drug/metabolite transporter (DMT)-like permease